MRVIHLAAIAGRLGLPLDLDAFDALGREVPVLVDLKPSGAHFMQHFHESGGVPRLLRELRPWLDTTAPTIDGRLLAEIIDGAEVVPGQSVIRGLDAPIASGGGLAVLRGNLAPRGALLKRSAATPALLRHEGRAVVFEGLEDLAERLDADDLYVTPDDVLVLRHAGPKGAPGMPEAGAFPIPRKLARQGVRDMLRISDARMSGTAFGTIVLHIAPESAVGGPLALVANGDRIRLDTEARRLDVLVDDPELARRRAAWRAAPEPPGAERGYLRLFLDQVMQADDGCDFAFCRAAASRTAGEAAADDAAAKKSGGMNSALRGAGALGGDLGDAREVRVKGQAARGAPGQHAAAVGRVFLARHQIEPHQPVHHPRDAGARDVQHLGQAAHRLHLVAAIDDQERAELPCREVAAVAPHQRQQDVAQQIDPRIGGHGHRRAVGEARLRQQGGACRAAGDFRGVFGDGGLV